MSSKVGSQSQGRVGTVGRIQGTLAQLWAKRNSSYFDSECFPSFLGGLHSDSSVRDSGHVAELVTDLPRRALVVQVRLAHLKFNFKINFSVFSAIQWASSQIREDNMYSYPAQVLASSWYGTHASLPPRHPTSDNADDQGVIVTTVIRGAPDVSSAVRRPLLGKASPIECNGMGGYAVITTLGRLIPQICLNSLVFRVPKGCQT